MKAKHIDLEKDYASLKYQYEEGQAEYKDMKMKLQSCEADKQILNHKLSKLQNPDGDEATDLGIIVGGDDGERWRRKVCICKYLP